MQSVNPNHKALADIPELTAGRHENTVAYKLRLAQILAYRAFEERVADQGAAPRYLGLLAIIAAHPGQPQSRIAEALGLQRSSLVAILDRLERDGLLERRPAENDRRSNAVWLTSAGRTVLDTLEAAAHRHEEALCDGLTSDERATTLSCLDHIIANLRRQTLVPSKAR